MMPIFSLNPIAILLLWLVAAFALIWTGPIFFPAAGSTVGVPALLWKLFAASVALFITLACLRRSSGLLGLRPSMRTFGLFALGVASGVALVGLWMAAFGLLVPFRLAPGTITARGLAASWCIYVFGALLEELAFRGHALIRLRQHYGAIPAVLCVSLAFGVLHLPGMTGVNAIKIIALTGCSSLLFCLAYLSSGSLWAAIGLHAGMNFMLHSILGAGGGSGPSLMMPVYAAATAPGYDAAFWSLMLVQLVCTAGLLLAWPQRPANLRWQAR